MLMTVLDYQALAQTAYETALEAGKTIMTYYVKGVDARIKADASPVTEADEAADRLIVERLRAAAPEIPVISEEGVAAGVMPKIEGRHFWLVDPLDGTKEFIKHTDEFTVNIALIEDGHPRVGVLLAPARGECYIAEGPGRVFLEANGEARRAIQVRKTPAEGAVVVASRSHRDDRTNAFIEEQIVTSVVSAGSSLKFGLVAKAEADLYPRFGPTMEWDTAAGHAVLSAAGGSVRNLEGEELVYGKADMHNPFFIARGAE